MLVRPLALVTGASSGLGLEIARLLARDRHDLLLVARRESELSEIAAELSLAHGIRCETFAADLTDRASRDELGELISGDSHPVDILINNAGFGLHGPFSESDIERELLMIELNVAALTHLAKLVLPRMLATRRGYIMNVGSVAGFVPGPLMAVYYATKAYVVSFSQALSEELEDSGVSVTAFCPGTTITGFQRAAGLSAAGAVRTPALMEATEVARLGYEGMLRGDRIVIPGTKVKLMTELMRHLPRGIVARMVRRVQERRRAAPPDETELTEHRPAPSA
jgi:uncharacterized protein